MNGLYLLSGPPLHIIRIYGIIIFIVYIAKMTESWLDSFSKFWSGQYKDKAKVE
jgi:hypothetical protein